MLAIS